MIKNCMNCRNRKIVKETVGGGYTTTENTVACWQHPESIDHPVHMSISHAAGFVCDEYIPMDSRLCRDCKCCSGDVTDVCMNIKNATVTTEGLIIPEEIDLNQKACTYFIPREEKQ